MKSKLLQILTHFLAWSVFISLLVSLVPRPRNMDPLLFLLIPNVIFVCFFYFNFYVLIPRFFMTKKYVIYGFICVLCLLFTISVPSLISSMEAVQPAIHVPPGGEFRPFNHGYHQPPFVFETRFMNPSFSYSIFVFAFVFILSLGIRITMQWQQSERQKVSSELAFLKAQINPHFLFNTLNSIYSMAVNNSGKTAEAIGMFSNMLRFVIHETRHDFVSLDHKLEYINDFISLQKLRLPSTVQVEYQVTGTVGGNQIAPMILMPFIENAFKYGVSAEHQSFIRIKVDLDQNELHLNVINTKFEQVLDRQNSSKLGIENTRKRLAILYPGKHLLNIQESPLEYHVSLHLVLS